MARLRLPATLAFVTLGGAAGSGIDAMRRICPDPDSEGQCPRGCEAEG